MVHTDALAIRPSRKRLMLVFVTLFLLVPLMGLLVGWLQGPRLEQEAYKALESIAQLKTRQIESWLDERAGDGHALVNDPGFIRLVLEAINENQTVARAALHQRLQTVLDAYYYDAISIIDRQTDSLRQITISETEPLLHRLPPELTSVPEDSRTSMPVSTGSSTSRYRPGEHVYYYVFEGISHIDFAFSLYASTTSEAPFATLVLHMAPDSFLFPYSDWLPAGSSAETLLVTQSGDNVVFISPLRHRQSTKPGTLTRDLNDPTLPAAYALRHGAEGIFAGRDYRDVEVLAAYQAVGDTGWQLIAKLDRDEVMAPLHTLITWVSLVTLVSAVLIGLLIMRMWHQQQRLQAVNIQVERQKADKVLRQFYDLPFIGIVITSPQSKRWLRFNDRLCDILGYPREELVEKDWVELTHPDDLEADLVQFERVMRNESDGYSMDKRFIRKDGGLVHAYIDVKCVRAADGNVDYFVAMVQDISERKQAEIALDDAHRQAQSYLDIAGVMIVALDHRANIQMINHRACEILGYSEQELLGKNWFEQCLPEYERDNIKVIFGKLMAGDIESVEYMENRIVTRTGEERIIAWHNTVLRNRHGAINGVLTSGIDMTARRAAQQALTTSNAWLRTLVQSIPDLVWLKDSNGVFLVCNTEFERLYGASEADIVGKTDYDFVDREQADFFREHDRMAMVADSPSINEETLTFAADGYQGIFETTKTPMYDELGELIGVLGIAHDITERKSIEAKVKLAANVFKQSREGIFITDVNNNIVMINDTFTQITGYSETETLGQNPKLLSSGRQDKAFYRKMWNAIDSDGFWEGEIWNRRKDGSIFPEWLSITRTYDEEGRAAGYIGIFEDITQRKEYEQHIQWLAHYDPLTGLPNRALLQDRIQIVIGLARRNNKQLAILLCDIDHFKNVNDALGHNIGDQLLTEAATRLLACTRKEDTVSRQGGDEFLILLPDANAEGAAHVAQKIQLAINRPYFIDSYEMAVSISIGIAIFPNDGDDFDTLAKNADIAMYRAKNIGRNNYCFYTPDLERSSARTLKLENDIHSAIDNNELEVYYQPQNTLTDGSISGVEALLRWNHPDFGMVSPLEFIPIAENSGQILRIGEWVTRTAVMQMKQWQDSGISPLKLSVNLSVRELRQSMLFEKLKAILDETGIDPHCLELEITESMLMEDQENVIHTLNQINELGIQLSIDDFGTGYSSLSYLKRLPVNQLKIDKTFVHDMLIDPGNAIIACSIISLGHSLGLNVIAEGVEEPEQLEFLRANLCDNIQGYLFSKPLPVDQVTRKLAMAEHLFLSDKQQSAEVVTLLIVDDEADTLRALANAFTDEGYQVLTADCGERGLDLLIANQAGVIIVNEHLSGMSSLAFLNKSRSLRPDAIDIMLSGDTVTKTVTDQVNRGSSHKYLSKPWDYGLLRDTVRDAFRSHSLSLENRGLANDLRAAKRYISQLEQN